MDGTRLQVKTDLSDVPPAIGRPDGSGPIAADDGHHLCERRGAFHAELRVVGVLVTASGARRHRRRICDGGMARLRKVRGRAPGLPLSGGRGEDAPVEDGDERDLKSLQDRWHLYPVMDI
jgi:hypothetical protein